MAANANTTEVCFLLAAERSGTHFLRSLLGKVPGVFAPGEISNATSDDIRTSPTSFLKFRASVFAEEQKFCYPTFQTQTELLDKYLEIVRSAQPASHTIILDVKYSHINNFNAFWWDMVARPLLIQYSVDRGIKIIHLVREKPYRTVISRMYAQESGVWRTQNPALRPSVKIRIDRSKLHAKTMELSKTISSFSQWLVGSRSTRISYETLTDESGASLASLREFLGFKFDIPTISEFVRTTPRYEEAIENFAEVADLIDIDLTELNICQL